MVDSDKLAYSPIEVATQLSCCLNTIYRMIKQKRLRVVRIDRKILVPRQELERLLTPSDTKSEG